MTSWDIQLRDRIAGRSARVCVVGLGYVGMATAVAFSEAGFEVVGVDVDHKRCTRLLASGMRASTSLAEAGQIDVVNICVPTPVDASGNPDIIVTTDHGAFDWDTVAEHARCVFDTRGCRREDANLAWNTL